MASTMRSRGFDRLPGGLVAQDIVWLSLFSVLGWIAPGRNWAELEMIGALAVLQLLAPRVRAMHSDRAMALLIAGQLVAGFLLIGVTGSINSDFWLILLLPVVSSATTLGPLGAGAFACLSCAAYLSYLPLAGWWGYELVPGAWRLLVLRALFLAAVAYLTYTLADANRRTARQAQAAAADLALANRRLLDAEDSVRRAERLAALGQLTAGLAHELRNPLGTIKAASEMLDANREAMPQPAAELAGYISSEVDRTNSLISRFLDFAKPLKPSFQPVDLNRLSDLAIEHITRQSPDNPPFIHRNYEPGLPPVNGDEELLERVLFNLIQNAIQASPPGAVVTVKTRHENGIVEAAVLDRGAGISPNDREQIFNPFFSNKLGGVGLGLAISAKIVGEHHGSIEVESQPGRGSTFILRLPVLPS
jgi:signal transduction histidine kinase